MIERSKNEFENLRSQFGTSNFYDKMGTKKTKNIWR